jgi:hypothetical protein
LLENYLGERQLIECWMGSKWGFYKFPLNSQVDIPDLETKLHWREVGLQSVLGKDENVGSLFHVNQVLDVRLSIELQLEHVKREFVIVKRQLKRSRVLPCYRLSQCGERWVNLLRIYDAFLAGATESELIDHLQLKGIPVLHKEARELVFGGYQRILLYAE